MRWIRVGPARLVDTQQPNRKVIGVTGVIEFEDEDSVEEWFDELNRSLAALGVETTTSRPPLAPPDPSDRVH